MKTRHKFVISLALFYIAGYYGGPVSLIGTLIGSFLAFEVYQQLY